MHTPKRTVVASAIAFLAFMTMLLPAFGGEAIDQAANDVPPAPAGDSLLSTAPQQSFTAGHTPLTHIRVYLLGTLVFPDTADVTLTVYSEGGTALD